MKQYTTPEQTAKLIEQGLPQPRTKIPFEVANDELGYTYSIGELIEMLPTKIEDVGNVKIMQITSFNGQWRVKYAGAPDAALVLGDELIDALYDMVVKLKEKGLI